MRIAVVLLFLAACGSKKADPGTGSSVASGSATITPTGSGSADGSGSAPAPAGSGSDGSAAATGSGSGVGSDGVPEGPFEKLDHDGKVAVMKKRVMPAMKKAFAEFDPKEFEKFTCKTCHGKDPEGSKYKMPTAELPKLDFKELEEGHDKKIAEFMAKVVKPEMAKILGEVEMSESNPNGFGCLSCHMEKK